MSYHNWLHQWFRNKHKDVYLFNNNPSHMVSIEKLLNDAFGLLEHRANEYLINNEIYDEMYIDPFIDVVNSKPQIIQQIRQELWDFLELLLKNRVKNVLQIGLGHYGSTHFIMSLLFDNIVTVEYDIKNIRNYADRELLYNQNIERFVHGDSTDPKVVDEVSRLSKTLGGFDCLFIDGNHSEEYVRKDWDNYHPFINNGGIVAFHDVLIDGERYGSPKVLKQLTEQKDVKLNYICHSKEIGIAWHEVEK